MSDKAGGVIISLKQGDRLQHSTKKLSSILAWRKPEKAESSTEIAPLRGGHLPTTMRMKMKPFFFKRENVHFLLEAWHDSDRGGGRLAVRQSCAPWNDVGRV
jgi:hypothetical protein